MSSIDEIRARWELTTPGPWHIVATTNVCANSAEMVYRSVALCATVMGGANHRQEMEWNRRNAEAIAAAPTDIHDLLAALDAANQRIAELEAGINASENRCCANCGWWDPIWFTLESPNSECNNRAVHLNVSITMTPATHYCSGWKPKEEAKPNA